MPDILHQIDIDAPRSRVLEGLVTEEGVSSWWTDDCDVLPEVGNVNKLRFDAGKTEMRFRVVEQRAERVRWECERGPRVPEEWIGTTVAATLEEHDGRTTVKFGHLGWASTEGAFASCNTVWGELLHRLKDWAEGRPVRPRFEA